MITSGDSLENPVTGQIQCRSQFDPASAVPLVGFASFNSVSGAGPSLLVLCPRPATPGALADATDALQT